MRSESFKNVYMREQVLKIDSSCTNFLPGCVPMRRLISLMTNKNHLFRCERNKKKKIGVFLEFDNKKANHLGYPFPKGVVRVYNEDSNKRLQFVGEDHIDHTPENETIRLKLGNAFDVTAERVRTKFKRLGSSQYVNSYESDFLITIKNAKTNAVSVAVMEPIHGEWDMIHESLPHRKITSNKAEWLVEVPAKGTVKFIYGVRVKR